MVWLVGWVWFGLVEWVNGWFGWCVEYGWVGGLGIVDGLVGMLDLNGGLGMVGYGWEWLGWIGMCWRHMNASRTRSVYLRWQPVAAVVICSS